MQVPAPASLPYPYQPPALTLSGAAFGPVFRAMAWLIVLALLAWFWRLDIAWQSRQGALSARLHHRAHLRTQRLAWSEGADLHGQGRVGLRHAIDWISSDFFTGDADDFKPLRGSLLEGGDPFLVLADFRSYADCQARVDAAYRNPVDWARMGILNTARMGKFSSDRAIREYADKIWRLPRVEIPG